MPRVRAHNANETETDVVTQRRKFLPGLRGIFSFRTSPRRPEMDNRVRSYRCSFQGSLSRKRADKQRHKVRVYLRPVCKAKPPPGFVAVYMRNETIRGGTLPSDFSANVCRRCNEGRDRSNSNGVSNGTFVPFGTINAIHIRGCCQRCPHFYCTRKRTAYRSSRDFRFILLYRRLLFASALC